MRPFPLLGLVLFAPTASLGQVVVTVWVGTGDCSPTASANGSAAAGSDEGLGTGTLAFIGTNSIGIVSTGIENSTFSIVPASVAYGSASVAVTSTSSSGAVPTLSTTPTSLVLSTAESSPPSPVTVETSNTATDSQGSTVASTSSHISIAAAATNNLTHPFIPAVGSPQPIPVTVETSVTAEDIQGSTLVSTSSYVSTIIAATIISTHPIIPAVAPPQPSSIIVETSTTTTDSQTEPSISPACSDNNTYYVDTFGVRYDIRCGLDFDDADVAPSAHADTFQGCIQYCSLLADCAGVSFQATTCPPISAFRGYRPETAAAPGTDLLRTAVPTAGPNDGSVAPDDLCAEGLDGQSYTDKFSCSWSIACGQAVAGAALRPAVQTDFEACITYCAFYDGCESVDFEGDGGSASSGANASANCFPMSSVGAVSLENGTSAASLLGACNVRSLVSLTSSECKCLYRPTVVRQPVKLAQEVLG